jgi:hypothetical protein
VTFEDRAARERRRNAARGIASLALGAGLAAVYLALAAVRGALTGSGRADGIVGVVLGLFVSSLPARHFVEMLFYWRVEGPRFASPLGRGLWAACNALVLIAGALVIVDGATRFIPAR